MRGRAGFTLVEILIVVAIIGILATLAVPAWDYASAKSRQVEAKENLEGIFALEISYHGEHNTYGSLVQIGFAPEGATRYSYCLDTTFANCLGASVNPFTSGAASSGAGGPGPGPLPINTSSVPPPGGNAGASIYVSPYVLSFVLGAVSSASGGSGNGNPHYSSQDFEADAYGIISTAPAPADVDKWSIDQRKQFVNYNVGY